MHSGAGVPGCLVRVLVCVRGWFGWELAESWSCYWSVGISNDGPNGWELRWVRGEVGVQHEAFSDRHLVLGTPVES